MPILPAEPQLYPPDLWQGEVGAVDPERPWWCLHTKPRQEKAAARHFLKGGVTFYLPQIIQESRTPGGRKVRSRLPLFTSYIFLQGDHHDRVEALRTDCLTTVLEVSNQPQLVHDLRQIHRILNSGLEVLPEPSYPIGTRVRIVSGPLVGLEGVVVRRSGKDRFVAIVSFLSRGATLELSDWQVEPVEVSPREGQRDPCD